MDLRLDSCRRMKRMRLNGGEVVDNVCIRHSPEADDECLLGLGSNKAAFLASSHHETGLGHSARIGKSSFRFSPADICDAGSIDLSASLSWRGGASCSAERDFNASCSEDRDFNVSSEVRLDLGLAIAPTMSGAESALTSVNYGAFRHSNVSGSPQFPHDSDVPMIDEGSTSNGRQMLPVLKVSQANKAPCSEAQRFEAIFTVIQDESGSTVIRDNAVHSEISNGFRAVSNNISSSGMFNGSGLVDRAQKMCRFTGCQKRARGASGLCISHGGGRRCQRLGCKKGAEGSTIFCKAHGGGRRCEYLGCTKSAEGKTDFCIAHGGGSRCLSEGCPKAARGRTGYCIRHGGGKRCQREGCTKSAEGYSALCIAHGGGKRCQYPNCSKGAQGNTMFCKGHGGGKRCTAEGCNKGAEGSTAFCKGHGGGKRCMFDGDGVCSKSVHGGTLYCVAHGGGKRCSVEGCTKSARGRTDCCVKHGGGKRCKFENCNKSAQGSTDFCKAHGGGKRCSWGQETFAVKRKAIADSAEFFRGSCDKTAKGKSGLCAEHSELVQDGRVHGTETFAGSFFSRNEVTNSAMHNSIGSKCKGVKSHEREVSWQISKGDEKLQQGSGGMQSGTWRISESHLFPESHGFQANRSSKMHISARSDTQSLARRPISEVQHPSRNPYRGLLSMHWPGIEREHAHGKGGPSSMEDDQVFDMSSLSLPEERVHGGNLLSLLSGGGSGA